MSKPKKIKTLRKPQMVYHIQEEHGRFYVYYFQVAPVDTLFDIVNTREEAEQAIEQHKVGKHSTQAWPDESGRK